MDFRRLIFIITCGLCILGSLYLGFRLVQSFQDKPVETSSNQTHPKALSNGKHSELRLSRSTSEKSEDSTAKSPSASSEEFKSQATVENNINNLLKLYEQGQDEEFLARLKELVAANPTNKEYTALLGDYYYNEQNWVEAGRSWIA